MSDFDAIVIGAGNAGLTAAATLQRAGAHTLLVERHNIPGGCATSFRRGRFEFEVALHQLSGLGPEGRGFTLRGLLASLGVADKLEFIEEDALYRAVVPGVLDVTLSATWEGIADEIEASFPGSRAQVVGFLDLVRKVTIELTGVMRGRRAERIDPLLFRQGLRSAQEVLDEHFTDDRVKHLLSAYWGYLGQPPSRLSFQDLALFLYSYLQFKPYHLRGGSQAMSTALLDAFLQAGGEVRFNTAAERILTDRGAVCGVRLSGGDEASADAVISNASIPTTYGMFDPEDVPTAVRTDLGTRRIGISATVLHMGLDATPEELGFTSSTSFVNPDMCGDHNFSAMRTLNPARWICVSCYDVAPIGFAPSGACHIGLMTLQYASAWEKVAPQDYARTKFAYAESLLDLVQYISPDIRDAIEEVDVATPLTMTRYLGHPGGAIYGFDQDASDGWQFRDTERESHIPGLYLAGAWSGFGGFQPTLEAGVRVARRVIRSKAA